MHCYALPRSFFSQIYSVLMQAYK